LGVIIGYSEGHRVCEWRKAIRSEKNAEEIRKAGEAGRRVDPTSLPRLSAAKQSPPARIIFGPKFIWCSRYGKKIAAEVDWARHIELSANLDPEIWAA